MEGRKGYIFGLGLVWILGIGLGKGGRMLIEADVYEDYILCDKQRAGGDDGRDRGDDDRASQSCVVDPPPPAPAPVIPEKKEAVEEESQSAAKIIDAAAALRWMQELGRDYKAYRLQSLGFLVLSTVLFAALLAIVVWQHNQILVLKERVEYLSQAAYIQETPITISRPRCTTLFPSSLCETSKELLGRLRSRLINEFA
ncbi:hypothetical protein SELMODRAFT_439385 [Selaginella moellendorffii]|uniref:Uncharacterized protein n=1 Tax=Selaginella moellendorffii TaxID=88036 RepID=D8R412_SELML|nr:uncharacterized protein LOC9636028 [Selaginella moellendorffii]EFJ33032.1 hypothetical protein SELMODRAFT_439385 [Selaginella moellendorffii]|eukprot:XP_002965612.1 uncharacterized protein LOC9636028 [Selaginella moellendorffii]